MRQMVMENVRLPLNVAANSEEGREGGGRWRREEEKLRGKMRPSL